MYILIEKPALPMFRNRQPAYNLYGSKHFILPRIRNLSDCISCIELIGDEIFHIQEMFYDGVNVVTFPALVYEACDDDARRRVEVSINNCREYVVAVSSLVNNYLNNGVMCQPGKTANIPEITRRVNENTKHVEIMFFNYNKSRKRIIAPSIDRWYIDFGGAVKAFNSCIDTWNKCRGTNFPKARLPKGIK